MRENYRKVFGKDLEIYFSYNTPSLRILVPLYYHQITPVPKAEYYSEYLYFTF
jgi:hypothetical protein